MKITEKELPQNIVFKYGNIYRLKSKLTSIEYTLMYVIGVPNEYTFVNLQDGSIVRYDNKEMPFQEYNVKEYLNSNITIDLK